MTRWLCILTLSILAFGCDSKAKLNNGSKPDNKPPKSSKPGKDPKPVKDKGDGFDVSKKEVLLEIYAADRAQGVTRLDTYKKYKLIDDSGNPHRERRKMYEQAIVEYAKKNPKEWGEYVDKLAREAEKSTESGQ